MSIVPRYFSNNSILILCTLAVFSTTTVAPLQAQYSANVVDIRLQGVRIKKLIDKIDK